MITNKKNWKFSNSAAIAISAYWYPFSETGAPTDLERSQYFPLKSFVIENKSAQEITVILDPIAGTSSKEFNIPNGKTLSLENKDDLYFHQLAIKNIGLIEIAISEIKVSVRNY